MSDKLSKRLTMGERFLLLGALPPADLVTFKILRKLKETLSPTEEEIKTYKFQTLYKCPHRDFSEQGKAASCEYDESNEAAPICPIHKEPMRPTGRVSWSPEKWNVTKEVYFGPKAYSTIVDTIKNLPEEVRKDNGDLVISLFEKFASADSEDE